MAWYKIYFWKIMGNPTPLYDILFQCEHTGANQEIVASPAGMIIMIIMCRHFLCVPTQYPNSIILSGSKPALLCQLIFIFIFSEKSIWPQSSLYWNSINALKKKCNYQAIITIPNLIILIPQLNQPMKLYSINRTFSTKPIKVWK